MIRSMTAFARQTGQGSWGVLTWELRSVNHRYLEVSTRLPEDLRALETAVRERAGKRLNRGKLDCALRYQRASGADVNISLNRELVGRLAQLVSEVDGLVQSPAPVSAVDLMRWPGAVEESGPDMSAVSEQAMQLFDQALGELVETREREGERLKSIVEQRCDAIEQLAEQVVAELPDIRAGLRQRLEARLAELDVEADPGRLEQELVIALQKIDVDEELDRLQTHVGEVRRVLQRDEPVGRRLDFLMQELNREANTLGSKSAAVSTTNASVDLKVLIEQMREQIQNIE